jgi:iron(III) transport system ATP-binding protein
VSSVNEVADIPLSAPTSPPQQDNQPAIAIRGVSKSFGRRSGDQGEQALRAVDLDVRDGEFLVLLGPSGCGKTTLLRSIAGLEHPDSGSIEIGGEVVFDAAQKIDIDPGQRPVNMIFQSYALWPHMTAAGNIRFPLRCARAPRSTMAGRIQEILTRVGIGHLGERYPSQMSGGQQQRLALARALVVGERVVLFDEPLSNVDAQVREKLRIELIRMQRDLGFTAIYVTHDQSEAMELADRIAVMSQGVIAQLGTPRELYDNPQDVTVARFLGQSNEITLTVDRFDASAGQVVGTAPFGRVVAAWRPRLNAEAPEPGEEIAAFGRPSDFVVTAAAPGGSEGSGDTNAWAGTVEAARFVGSHLEHLVRLDEVRLRCWAVSDMEEIPDGSDVIVSIRPDRLQAIRST